MDFYSHSDHIFHSCSALRCCCVPITFYHTSNSKIAQFATLRQQNRLTFVLLSTMLVIVERDMLFFVHINIDIDCMTSFGRNIEIFFCFITKSLHCALIEAEKNCKPIGMWYIVKCSYSQWKICEYANESQWMERERRGGRANCIRKH